MIRNLSIKLEGSNTMNNAIVDHVCGFSLLQN